MEIRRIKKIIIQKLKTARLIMSMRPNRCIDLPSYTGGKIQSIKRRWFHSWTKSQPEIKKKGEENLKDPLRLRILVKD